jgi:hypothetical protein
MNGAFEVVVVVDDSFGADGEVGDEGLLVDSTDHRPKADPITDPWITMPTFDALRWDGGGVAFEEVGVVPWAALVVVGVGD